jgi:hypothetical protein
VHGGQPSIWLPEFAEDESKSDVAVISCSH